MTLLPWSSVGIKQHRYKLWEEKLLISFSWFQLFCFRSQINTRQREGKGSGCRLKTHQSRHDGVPVPPRSCPWCRQHLHFHRRSQTFSWMGQSTLMTKPVLCSRAGFLMHWKRQREGQQRETVTSHYTNAETKRWGARAHVRSGPRPR